MSLFMKTFLLVHTLNSPEQKHRLEKYLSGLSVITNFESENHVFFYEFKTGIEKNELVRLLVSFLKELSLKTQERVVLYDTEKWTAFEKTGKCEKILLNGNKEAENQVEENIRRWINRKHFLMVLKHVQNEYFSSENTNADTKNKNITIHMKIDELTLKKTTLCLHDFKCLKDKNYMCTVAKVNSCIDGKILFIDCPKHECRYRLSFGDGSICQCPVRKDIYNKYRV